ncbi:MAG: carcinine hydrolase/isopenicillin-N N-acyltransferase family protein, partial [Phycisphaerae bacterium]
MVTVHVPPADSNELGWVSVFWPGLIGCTTGMNAEGVTVAMHDSNSPNPTTAGGFTPSLLLYRKAVESARAQTAVDDISRVLAKRYTVAGYNMMMTRPHTGLGPAAVVFEHDADLTKTRGMTVREPEDSNAFLACTNHSRKRYEPAPGIRYPKLSNGLEKIARSGGRHQL